LAPRGERTRVAVTGIGAVSGYGWSAAELWRGLCSGISSIVPTQRLDTSRQRTHLASEVPSPPPASARRLPGWRRFSQAERFAVVAALEATRQAGLALGTANTGVFFGGSTAGMAEGERLFAALIGPGDIARPLALLATQPLNGPGDAVARILEIEGPVESVSSACASGALAIALALEALRAGTIDVAIAGGSDSLCSLTYSGFNALRAVDSRSCRPFRRDRSGLSLGEGAAVLVLERWSEAATRGVEPLAELLGAGASCDAYHMTAPHPEGEGAAAAIEAALQDAGVSSEAISFVNAHGTGTPQNDIAEWHALQRVFGPRAASLPVTSTKAAVGHLLGSAGALEAVASVQCLRAGQIHPTPGGSDIDPETAVDLVLDEVRPIASGARVLSTSFAFGGANAALVLGAASASDREAH
jgi:3-oxoacyl-[acyl-carrier-protein] synthase II